MTIIDLAHPRPPRPSMERVEPVSGILTMVLESVGPMRHAVSVPFHDSQARGKAILIRTGWDERRETDSYGEPGPYLHEDLVFRIIRANVKVVGVDFWNIDEKDRVLHEQLLAKNIAVVLNLAGLDRVPKWGARFFASDARAYVEV